MKKTVALVIVFLSSLVCSYAQPASVPINSLIHLSDAQTLINAYQDPSTAYKHPSSFLLPANDVRKYLASTMHPQNDCYLHVYFASNGTDTFIAMIGTIYASSAIVHDPTMDSFLCTSVCEPNCCTIFDADLDGIDHNDDPTCDRSLCVRNVISKKDIYNKLKNYQTAHAAPANTQSFLFNANALRNFLLSNSDVKYLQIYLAIDVDNLKTADKLTLIFVGVDASGIHIPYNLAGENFVFNECIPCPKCYIKPDGLADYKPQFLGNSYKNNLFGDRVDEKLKRKIGNRKPSTKKRSH